MAKIERSKMTQKIKGKVTRAPKTNASETANLKWWTVKDSEMAASIAATLRFIQTHQSSRIEQLTMSTRLYGSTAAYNLMGAAFTRVSSAQPSTGRMSYNICSSVVDTLESKMAKNKVIPTYITNGGMWGVQKKAKQLTKFTQGLFYQEKAHEKVITAFSDAGVWGDGFVYVYNNQGKVCIERVLPHELWVDQIESMVADPTQLHRPKIMDRDIALAMFPDLKEHILTVSPATYQEIGGQGTAADLIIVVESWKLPSAKDAGDGLHVISIGDGVIKTEYKKDYFPFPHFRYAKRKIGWYGQGACERLQNLQGEVNKCMILKARSLWMMGSFKILLENGSKVVKQHLDNEVATIVTYTGTPPQYVTPPATNPELQQWIDSLIQKAYQQEGVSQMSTTGEAPIGVESGKALRTLNQIGDDRFLFMTQELEDFALEIARQAIEVAKEIYEDTGTYQVIFPNTNFMETVDWKDIKLDEEQYVLKAYPTSSLSDDLTGRLSEIQELMQAGLVSPRTGRRLMDMPDIEMNDSLSNAAEDYLHKCLEEMLYDGKTHSPEQFDDLTLAKQLALEYYAYAKYMNCPEKYLGIVRTFMAQIDDITKQTAQALAPAMAPMANPQATPTTNLTPNVNQGVA